jgi:hypothetical protein
MPHPELEEDDDDAAVVEPDDDDDDAPAPAPAPAVAGLSVASTSASTSAGADSTSASTASTSAGADSTSASTAPDIDWSKLISGPASDEKVVVAPKLDPRFAGRMLMLIIKNDETKLAETKTAGKLLEHPIEILVPYDAMAVSSFIEGLIEVYSDCPADGAIPIPICYEAGCEWTPKSVEQLVAFCNTRAKHVGEYMRKYEDRTFREIRLNREGWEYGFMRDIGMLNTKHAKPLIEFSTAAEFFGIDDAAQLVYAVIAFDYLITKTTDQLREWLEVTDDMTKEEHAEIDKQYAWYNDSSA